MPAPVVQPPAEQPPILSSRFELDEHSEVVGELQVIVARHEDTFADIARAYGLGFDELEHANPGVDAWLPGAGTRIVLPTRFVLPDAPREGIVLNIGTKRLFYFPKPVAGQPRVVITHPVGIGREGWQTPLGTTKVVAKNKDPVWTVPASIRREHAAAGDPLPARVGPGPDNPLGAYAMRLGFPGYLIHGTNKPDGIGMRVSHGCVQLFPEDIESLFAQVPVGTPVRIINEPRLLGWRGDNLYLEVHPALEDDRRDLNKRLDALIAKELGQTAQRSGTQQAQLDPVLFAATVREARGFPVPLLQPAADAQTLINKARLVVNVASQPAAEAAPPAPVRQASDRHAADQ
ncbi:MAG: L,D-transpeptidase family protein [Gammaproteobacteria bacterium]|nr:L,D-transpeptidase family protein [Gammaproteobacteria bacterium]